jgi:hypothetical protein
MYQRVMDINIRTTKDAEILENNKW